MAKFLYLLRNSGECVTTTMSPEETQQVIQKYMAWIEKLGEAFVAGEKLRDGEGRVLEKDRGIVKDGPFSETKEVVAGFWIVQAKDIEHAAALAEELPWGAGSLEIRPIDEA